MGRIGEGRLTGRRVYEVLEQGGTGGCQRGSANAKTQRAMGLLGTVVAPQLGLGSVVVGNTSASPLVYSSTTTYSVQAKTTPSKGNVN